MYIGFGKFVEEWCKVGGVDNVGNCKGKINIKGYVVFVYDLEWGYFGEVCFLFVEWFVGFDLS